jgi:hypothetical protein
MFTSSLTLYAEPIYGSYNARLSHSHPLATGLSIHCQKTRLRGAESHGCGLLCPGYRKTSPSFLPRLATDSQRFSWLSSFRWRIGALAVNTGEFGLKRFATTSVQVHLNGSFESKLSQSNGIRSFEGFPGGRGTRYFALGGAGRWPRGLG